MTQLTIEKIDLVANLKFLTKLQIALGRLTEADISSLPAGKPAEAGAQVTDVFLSYTLKAILAACDKMEAEYKKKKFEYERLTPSDAKVQPFANLVRVKHEYELFVNFFRLSFYAEYGHLGLYHSQMGFDDDFQIWFGGEVVRDASDLDVFPNRSVIRR